MVAGRDRFHARAGFDHDAGAFMAEDGGEDAFGVFAAEAEGVGVADAAGFDLNQNFPGFRPPDFDFFDAKRGAGFPGDCGFGFHWAAPGWMAANIVADMRDAPRVREYGEHR